MRAGEALVPMSEDQLRRIFAEGSPIGSKRRPLPDSMRSRWWSCSMRRLFSSCSSCHTRPNGRACWNDSCTSGWWTKPPRVHDPPARCAAPGAAARRLSRCVAQVTRVVVYSGTSKLETRLDQTGSRGYAVGFQGLVRFVMTQLPQNEVIEDALRKEVKLVPDLVIRELVANALIHQDFIVGGAAVMVEIYSNRVEISNPGEPLVPVERFIDGYQSRNERLAI